VLGVRATTTRHRSLPMCSSGWRTGARSDSRFPRSTAARNS
jgi:hypothetical protein